MNVNPLSPALGAHISDIDLRGELTNAEASMIHAEFLRHKVLFFHDQHLAPTELLRFASLFGEAQPYPFIEGLPGAPEVIEILKTESDTVNFGGSWHSDTAYLEKPSLGSVLHALEVPSCGGDTLFANTAIAHDALSSGMQAMLTTLRGVNSSDSGYSGGRAAGMARIAGMKNSFREDAKTYEASHPIVRTHPETGRKSLYLSATHTHYFEGMTREESKPLIDYLCAHITRPEFTCRFAWRPGSVAVWDNRTTQHFALNDYHGQRRRMHRVTLKGDTPR